MFRVHTVNYFAELSPGEYTRASHSICTRTSRTRYSTMGACYNVLISSQCARRVRKIAGAQRYTFTRNTDTYAEEKRASLGYIRHPICEIPCMGAFSAIKEIYNLAI